METMNATQFLIDGIQLGLTAWAIAYGAYTGLNWFRSLIGH